MRCPKCNERFQPSGSLEAGNLNVRCPHCAARKRQKRAARSAANIELPMDPLGGPSGNWIWITALAGGAVLLALVCMGLLGAGIVHLGSPRNVATPAKAPTTHNAPTRISSPDPEARPEPGQPFAPEVPDAGKPLPRNNDNDWDR